MATSKKLKKKKKEIPGRNVIKFVDDDG